MTDEAFQNTAIESVKKFADANTLREAECKEFAKALAYVAGEYHDPAAFGKLKNRLDELDRTHKLNGNRLFYLATPPDVYLELSNSLTKPAWQKIPTANPGRESLSRNRTAATWLRRGS